MTTVLAWLGLGVILVSHTVFVAILTRVFRVRLATRWGPFVYVGTVIPVVLFVSTLLLSGVFGLGPDLGGIGPALFVTLLVPLAVGVAIDYFWMPPPDEVDLPETQDEP